MKLLLISVMYFELSSADKIISIIYIFKNRPVNIQVQGCSAHEHFNFMAKSLKEANIITSWQCNSTKLNRIIDQRRCESFKTETKQKRTRWSEANNLRMLLTTFLKTTDVFAIDTNTNVLIVIQVFALQSIPRNHIMVATVTGYLNSWLFPDRNIISDQMSNASLQRDAFTLIRPHHQRVTRSRYTVTQTIATTLHCSLWWISAAFYDIKHKYYIQQQPVDLIARRKLAICSPNVAINVGSNYIARQKIDERVYFCGHKYV